MTVLRKLLTTTAAVGALVAISATSAQAGGLSQLDDVGQDALETYLTSDAPKAFAIAPDGSWGWSAGNVSMAGAEAEALANCEAYGNGCTIYGRNSALMADTTDVAVMTLCQDAEDHCSIYSRDQFGDFETALGDDVVIGVDPAPGTFFIYGGPR